VSPPSGASAVGLPESGGAWGPPTANTRLLPVQLQRHSNVVGAGEACQVWAAPTGATTAGASSAASGEASGATVQSVRSRVGFRFAHGTLRTSGSSPATTMPGTLIHRKLIRSSAG